MNIIIYSSTVHSHPLYQGKHRKIVKVSTIWDLFFQVRIIFPLFLHLILGVTTGKYYKPDSCSLGKDHFSFLILCNSAKSMDLYIFAILLFWGLCFFIIQLNPWTYITMQFCLFMGGEQVGSRHLFF